MTVALTHRAIFLLAMTFLLSAATHASRNQSAPKQGGNSLERFAGTWEGKCKDGATFIVVVLQVGGTQPEGTVSIGNMDGAHSGACVSVLAPPVAEHSQKITEAIVKQKILSFNGSKRQNGTFTRFELTQTDVDKAQLKLVETPVEHHL
jgi:hypothetical protein